MHANDDRECTPSVDEDVYRLFMHNVNVAETINEFVLDAQGEPHDLIFHDVNAAYCEDLGLTREQVIGRLASEVYGDDVDVHALVRTYHQAVTSGARVQFEAYYAPSRKTYLVAVCPLGGLHFAVMATDITERKQMEEEVRQAKADAEAANQVKSQFLTNMSREIGTPLNAIVGITELLQNSPATAVERELLDALKVSADSLLLLINDVLDFARIEVGKLELHREYFNLPQTIADLVSTLALRAREKGLSIACYIAPEIPAILEGDAARLRQLLISLIGNAIKFTARGQVLVTANVESRADHQVTIHFTISDTGIGIPENDRRRIFAAFAQASNTASAYGGSGLGLAISARLAVLMGGGFWVESTEGVGSTFHLHVPLTQPASTNTTAQAAVLANMPVLIVDGTETTRVILANLLTRWGMQPVVAATAGRALLLAQEACASGMPIPLMLINQQLPDMDGQELAALLYTHTRAPAPAPAIILLSDQDHELRRSPGAQAGVVGILTKPVKPYNLLTTLQRIAERASAPHCDADAPITPPHRSAPG